MSDESQKYKVKKIARKENAKHFSWVPSGFEVIGYAMLQNEKGDWRLQSSLIPKFDKPVMFSTLRMDSDRLITSRIVRWYIHGDYENSPDKIVFGKHVPLTLLDGISFNQGDILLETLNSFYFCQAI